jgi:hypothetical protein
MDEHDANCRGPALADAFGTIYSLAANLSAETNRYKRSGSERGQSSEDRLLREYPSWAAPPAQMIKEDNVATGADVSFLGVIPIRRSSHG